MHPLRAGESQRTSRNPSICQADQVGGMRRGQEGAPGSREFTPKAPLPQSLYRLPWPRQEPAAVWELCVTLELPSGCGLTPCDHAEPCSSRTLSRGSQCVCSLAHEAPSPGPCQPFPLASHLGQPVPSGPAFLKPMESFCMSLLFTAAPLPLPQRGPGEVLLVTPLPLP